ncbi:RNA recognition motif domain [Plasmopara halstedii]|uniref:RNA recognition motif domain n=1 Tax=Plasmopara halstedii TaxID=4781 RepID=A0A0P1A483_PLAHL|nr:RNA recognition motif domain [Plasmopara halstedii]CEG35290.1 RNA recognition motif domain [Plasmopara halstedii]|eukprot:XP_024571659.1 RNA recognition motif domain [Plasmopara halstedii]
MAEDMLTELYAWDSEIEDVSALATDDPKRDDDKAEDAYEKIIHAASVDDANDVVLSLAAQLLHKHFFHFPHVQLNVVDVLLKLCESKRSQAVRIHTLRALLQIVKTPPATAIAPTPTSASSVAHIVTRTWMLRIEENVIQMLDNEKSPVILRQVTPLRQALEERLQQVLSQSSINAADNDKNINMSPPLEQSRKHLRDVTQANDGVFSAERENKKPKFDDESSGLQSNRGKIVQLNRDWSNAHDNSNEDTSSWKEKTLSDRIVENEGRRPKFSAQSPRNCPPCPYLFLGSLPRHTPSADIVEFLSPISAEIDTMKVQIKEPDFNANAYAFISMPTIEHARLAIHFVNENKFQGRNYLNANFARGPPVDTLLFVERTADNVRMEDKDAVRDFDFTKCDPDVWNDLCQQLEQFGPLTFAEKGCVRFRNVEHAKAAIRKQLFTVMGYSILPVYDIKEQFAIDSTRRGFNAQKKQGFALKSGRLVGGDDDDRSKNTYYREDETFMDGPNGRREHDQVMSLKYDERSSLRNDRESFRGRSRSPKVHHSSGRYDAPMIGMTRERRAPRSRSHSPVMQSKPGAGDGGYGTFSDKENYRELQSKYAHRSPSPIDNRSHERSVFDEEIRGRSHGRGISWMEPRPMESSRKHRELPEEVQSHRSSHRGGFPSPSFGSRHSRKNESGKQRSSDYRHNSEDVRQSYRRGEPMLEGCGKMQPPSPNSALQLSRSHSRSPPRFSKYGGSSRSRPRSRSRSPHIGISMESSVSQRSGGNRGHEKRSIGMHLPDERLSLPAERPRYADERSIAEVARDEQQERQRFFQQQSQGRRDNHDADLSRYGSGSVIGQSGSSGRGGLQDTLILL